MSSVKQNENIKMQGYHAREAKVQFFMSDGVDVVVCDAKVVVGRCRGKGGRR